MSALRQRLKQPHAWLALYTLLAIAPFVESYRPPAEQLTGRLYVRVVTLYHAWASPLLANRIRCRYRPTCSQYSIEAVRRHGLLPGLILTWRRVRSCLPAVPFGTVEAVP